MRRGNFSMAYDPQEKEKQCIKQEMLLKRTEPMYDDPISVDIEFYMPIPKSLSKKLKMSMANESVFHSKKPDLDNLIKLVFDCGNETLWKDDAKICKGSFVKKYSDNPRTVININRININGEEL